MDLYHYNCHVSEIHHYYSRYRKYAITISHFLEICHYVPFRCVYEKNWKIPSSSTSQPDIISPPSLTDGVPAEMHAAPGSAAPPLRMPQILYRPSRRHAPRIAPPAAAALPAPRLTASLLRRRPPGPALCLRPPASYFPEPLLLIR